MRRFTITTLGCKVNQYEGSAITAALRRAGLVPSEAGKSPDLLVVNTCCVTTTAMRKSRQAIRRVVRKAPNAWVFVLGCYGVYHEARIRQILESLKVPPKKILIAGHHDALHAAMNQMLARSSFLLNETPDKTKSSDFSEKVPASPPIDTSTGSLSPEVLKKTPGTIVRRRQVALQNAAPATQGLPLIDHFSGHQRAFVKVQDGCDAFCNYCIVPYTRPRVWSKTIKQVEEESLSLLASGHREIVLCGVFLGAFGRRTAIRRRWDERPGELPQLLRRVAGIEGLWRVRLSSLEPGDLTDDLLGVMKDLPAVAPHLHLPLQSGSQRILQRMNRQYTADEFRRTVQRVRETLDRPAITTDIIVGYPGESAEDFAETLATARCAEFAKIHAFPFSPIEPTPAWRYRHEAPPPELVRERLERLGRLEGELAEAYRRCFVGETMEGLVEGPSESTGRNVTRAMTDRYMTVEFDSDREDLIGRVVNLRIESTTPAGLRGRLV